jgi:hypothetical protein
MRAIMSLRFWGVNVSGMDSFIPSQQQVFYASSYCRRQQRGNGITDLLGNLNLTTAKSERVWERL